jgi:hypothetical protein
MPVNPRYLVESFAAAAEGENILEARHVFEKGNPLYALLHVSGTFEGTVVLECSPPGADNYVAASLGLIAPTCVSVLIAADSDWRFNATTVTSGQIDCFLALPA